MAGGLTADYLLANRIPGVAQAVFRIMPARLSAWALMRLISAHAWTFAGSGVFSFAIDSGAEARIGENPLCSGLRTEAPSCVWHAAVFEGLFRALVSATSRAQETSCRARGDDCCRFRLEWAGGTRTKTAPASAPRRRIESGS
jgi:divinyl protochlorophyllide a 8-vinyl-reductase